MQVVYSYLIESMQLRSLNGPTCHLVSHLLLWLTRNQSSVLIPTHHMPIHLIIEALQGLFNISPSRDPILLMLCNMCVYSCMTRGKNTCTLSSALCATFRVLLIMACIPIHLSHLLFSLIQMLIGVGVWIPDALHWVIVCFLVHQTASYVVTI